MGKFIHHLSGGIAIGAISGSVAYYHLHIPLTDAAACSLIACASSMLPDIDSPNSRPNDMAFGLASVLSPVFVLQGMGINRFTSSQIILIALGVYVVVRYGIRRLMQECSVHRGMFHSIPAAIIWGALVYQAFRLSPALIKNAAAASALVGFITHLIIDEVFSFVTFDGMRIAPKKSFGTALKFFSPSILATTTTYTLMVIVLYACFRDMRIVR
ncbi:MAG: metal-dependent hydrolase [Bacteroidota bacterium]|nr:metal-dependent hydrolase [Candidatus Kapabacteria bacterium]MDW8219063.1 metal-dependent hydrolase [Bacteroidota bacterium]